MLRNQGLSNVSHLTNSTHAEQHGTVAVQERGILRIAGGPLRYAFAHHHWCAEVDVVSALHGRANDHETCPLKQDPFIVGAAQSTIDVTLIAYH